MWSNATQLEGPLYDPNSKIINYMNEDIEQIRLNVIQNDGHLHEDPNFYYSLEEDNKEWKRPGEICENPYFIKNKPKRFDALQGEMEDCWLIAAMEVLTLNKDLIKHVVPLGQTLTGNLYFGAFHFRFWKLGTWFDVVVDDRLPVWLNTNKLCYAYSRSGEVFWACLLEKAYAKFCGHSYGNLAWGRPNTALQDLSGGITEDVFTLKPPIGKDFKWFINRAHSLDSLMCGTCWDNIEAERKDLFEKHIYSITKVFRCKDDDPISPGLFLLRIMNPQLIEWTGDFSDNSQRWEEIDQQIREKFNVKKEDGEFWMQESDFEEYFGKISVCHLGPGQYVKGQKILKWNEKVEHWKTTSFKGEWVSHSNAGGSDLSTRHINPQYMVKFSLQENATKDDYISVVIELTQRSIFTRLFKRNIRFYIYSLKNISDPPKPLDYDFFQSNKALNEDDVDFATGIQRTYAARFLLDIDTEYCIVPCTENEDEEMQFLLRVWSENPNQVWEYDTQISKSLPYKEESLCETDDGLKKMFQDLADRQDEIDWVTLKTILEKSMNKNQSYFAIFKTCYILIWGFFEIFLPRSSNDDCETGEIVFSKDACRSMISMLDDDRSGKLNFTEFKILWKKIGVWTEVYNRYIGETEGCMKVSQLREALSATGYNLNKRTIHVLIHLYADEQGNITLVDFILCGVNLETGISLYQKIGVSEDTTTFTLEEWLKHTLFL